eukprot:8866930-Pyramimonas_sp.AAC.1
MLGLQDTSRKFYSTNICDSVEPYFVSTLRSCVGTKVGRAWQIVGPSLRITFAAYEAHMKHTQVEPYQLLAVEFREQILVADVR